jgi:hypothetical protein
MVYGSRASPLASAAAGQPVRSALGFSERLHARERPEERRRATAQRALDRLRGPGCRHGRASGGALLTLRRWRQQGEVLGVLMRSIFSRDRCGVQVWAGAVRRGRGVLVRVEHGWIVLVLVCVRWVGLGHVLLV